MAGGDGDNVEEEIGVSLQSSMRDLITYILYLILGFVILAVIVVVVLIQHLV